MNFKPNITPLTLGLISDPPTLVLVYEESEVLPLPGSKVKRRKRKIPLRQFTDKSSAEKTARTIHLRHEKYLEQVPVILIEKLLRIIQEVIKGLQPDEAAEKVNAEYTINPEEDLNEVPATELAKKKLIMEESFELNRLRPTDPGYSYDKQIDFDRTRKVKSGWDDDDDEEEAQEKPHPKISEPTLSSPPTFSKLQPLMEKISLLAQEDMNNSQLGITDETNLIETIVDNDDEDDFW